MRWPWKNWIFDLYGTLVDIHTDESREEFWRSLHYFLALKGASWTADDLRRTYLEDTYREQEWLRALAPADALPEIDLGKIFRNILVRGGLPGTDAQVADLAVAFRAMSLQHLSLYDGARELLEALKATGCQVYLLSNAQSLFTMPELDALELRPFFDDILLSSDAGRRKPDPAFFHMLLDRHALLPEETVMVGNDDGTDCRAADALGMASFYIPTAQSPWLQRSLPESCTEIHSLRFLFP